MVNVKLCAVFCILVTLALFVVFAYLMTTVNPMPLYQTNQTLRYNNEDDKVLMDDDYGVVYPSLDGELRYGLAKVSNIYRMNASVLVAKNQTHVKYINSPNRTVLINSLIQKNIVQPMQVSEKQFKNPSNHSSVL
ncbi:hypothetical protein ACJJTC_018602 [Scirpophaga incertulas]